MVENNKTEKQFYLNESIMRFKTEPGTGLHNYLEKFDRPFWSQEILNISDTFNTQFHRSGRNKIVPLTINIKSNQI